MPRPRKLFQNSELLEAALEGLELQKQRIDQQIQEVRSLLGKGTRRRGRPPGVKKKSGPGRLSVAARGRIAAAQKRRWAEYRKSASAKAE
jgi:hypothetical protein